MDRIGTERRGYYIAPQEKLDQLYQLIHPKRIGRTLHELATKWERNFHIIKKTAEQGNIRLLIEKHGKQTHRRVDPRDEMKLKRLLPKKGTVARALAFVVFPEVLLRDMGSSLHIGLPNLMPGIAVLATVLFVSYLARFLGRRLPTLPRALLLAA